MKHNFYPRRRKSTRIFIFTTLLIAFVSSGLVYFFNQQDRVVIAEVNDEKIFQGEVEQKLEEVFFMQDQSLAIPELNKLPKEVLEILVKEIYLEKMLTKEAKNSQVTRNQKTRDKIYQAKAKILRQTYIDSLINKEITEEKINERYVQLSDELEGKKEYHISQIMVKTKEEAEKILAELKSKKSPKFVDLAKKYSLDRSALENSGDLGYILENNLPEEISVVIDEIKIDHVSEPIQTKMGWYLIKVHAVRDVEIPAFESVKSSIKDQLVQGKINEINGRIIKDVKIKFLLKSFENSQEKKDEKQQEKEAEISENIENPDEGLSQNLVASQQELNVENEVAIDGVASEVKNEVKKDRDFNVIHEKSKLISAKEPNYKEESPSLKINDSVKEDEKKEISEVKNSEKKPVSKKVSAEKKEEKKEVNKKKRGKKESKKDSKKTKEKTKKSNNKN